MIILSQGSLVKKDLWTKGYLFLLSVNLLLCFGFYMLPPTLPAYVKQIGGSNLQASLVFGMFSLTSLITRIISGSIVEIKGEKTVMFTGMIIVVACSLSYIWLPVNGILLVRVLQGVGWGLATPAIATAIYKIVPENRRGEGGGYYSLTIIMAASLTPIGAILIMNQSGFTYVLIISALVTSAAVAALAASLPHLSTVVTRPAPERGHSSITLKNIFERGAIFPSFLCFLLSIPLCGIMGYLVLFGQELQIGNIWVYFLGYTITIMLTRPFIGKLFDKKGHVSIILPGSILMISGLISLALTQSTGMLIISSLLYGLGYGAVQPSLQTWAVNRCPENRKGAANGLFLSSIDLGYMLGSIILGYIAEITSYAAMYGYSAIFMIIFLAIYVAALIQTRIESRCATK